MNEVLVIDFNLDLNFYDEINKIRTSLNTSNQPTPIAKTSTGLNYILGLDDE